METWAVFGSEDTTAIWVEDESGKRVCTMRNCETDLDRARLIADAPQTAADRDRLQALNAELVAALEEFEIEDCPRCNGTGHEDKPNDGDACHRCAGAGEILRGGWPAHVRAALAKSKEAQS